MLRLQLGYLFAVGFFEFKVRVLAINVYYLTKSFKNSSRLRNDKSTHKLLLIKI